MLALEELDAETRARMVAAFQAEWSMGRHFVPARLTDHGLRLWPDLLSEAIEFGDDESLYESLLVQPGLIVPTEMYERAGRLSERRVNLEQAARALAVGEFNTFYVNGLAAKLIAEGVSEVEIYRAAVPKWQSADCAQHEGLVVSTQVIFDAHRARYWPVLNPYAFAVPFHSGCHHSIRRVTRS